MASALCGLGPVAAHSDYHGEDYTLYAQNGQEKGPADARGPLSKAAKRYLRQSVLTLSFGGTLGFGWMMLAIAEGVTMDDSGPLAFSAAFLARSTTL